MPTDTEPTQTEPTETAQPQPDTGAAGDAGADRVDPQRFARLARGRIKGRGSPIGPATYLADRQAALAAMRWDRFELRPIGPSIGATVDGVDLAGPLDEATIDDLRRALVAHKVLVFREQHLDGATQAAFARRFGDLETHPFLAGSDEQPELVRLAKDAAVGGYENIWHSDVSWRERPALGAVLRAVEVPEVGGDTLWADMGAAYLALDDDLRALVDDAVAVHDFSMSFGMALDDAALAEARAAYPTVEHPVIRTHPESGERIVYVNRIFTSHIVGLDEATSEAVLAELCAQAEVPEHQMRLHWEPGMVVFWDNRATQHYAVSDYWPQVRVMERAAIVGDRPQ